VGYNLNNPHRVEGLFKIIVIMRTLNVCNIMEPETVA